MSDETQTIDPTAETPAPTQATPDATTPDAAAQRQNEYHERVQAVDGLNRVALLHYLLTQPRSEIDKAAVPDSQIEQDLRAAREAWQAIEDRLREDPDSQPGHGISAERVRGESVEGE